VLRQIRDTLAFSILLFLHKSMLAISLYQIYLTAVVEHIALPQGKIYASIAAALRKLQAGFFSCTTVFVCSSSV
jgi:hypothetical protein